MPGMSNHKIILNQQYLDLLQQCQQTQKANSKKIKKSKFNVEEDEKLRELVERFGENQWTLISHQMKNRNARQCRERWKNYLNPHLNSEEWSEQEDYLLLSKFNEVGPKWKKISLLFKNRTTNSIRNRLIKIIKKTNINKNIQFDSNHFALPQFPTFSLANSNVQNGIIPSVQQKNGLENKISQIQTQNKEFSPNSFIKDASCTCKHSENSLENLGGNKCTQQNLKSNNEAKKGCPLFGFSDLANEIENDEITGLFWDNDDEDNKNSFINIDFM